jgi:WD40 repeat protein
LGFSRGDGGAIPAAEAGQSNDICPGVIDALVHSVKERARGPWLCPKQRCFTRIDRRGLDRLIRHKNMTSLVSYSLGNENYVALGCEDGKVYLYRLDSEEVVNVLQEEGAGSVRKMAVSEASSSKALKDGTDSADTTWLVVADGEGVVRICEVETGRCILRLDAIKDGLKERPEFAEIEIARDRGRIVAWDDDNVLLHVWDISPEGEETRYERGLINLPSLWRGAFESIKFMLAAAALLGNSSRPLKDCSNDMAQFESRSKGS